PGEGKDYTQINGSASLLFGFGLNLTVAGGSRNMDDMPAGGDDQGGMLTEAVRRQPYSVVLLDEIEKAHPDVFNVLLQVLDDGRMTDGKGRTVSFKNTIMIMTSNLGSHLIMELGEKEPEEMQRQVDELLHRQFRPEFLNRVDEIITFHGLSREDLLQIVDIQINRMAKRLAQQKYTIELTEAAKQFLVETGYDPSYGARPLKRAIQRYIEDPLALEILEGRFSEGDTVRIDRGEENRLVFGKSVINR
ncbi:MAG: hypothetical protein D3912_09050, partial [Candidatus Electrothrix sp. AX1]|nr:hypothetical protein [Candidatus Electrothrix sp. AX1]